MKLVLSPLPKTWIFDVDGTILKHNGYLSDGGDELLNGVREFFDDIPNNDLIILLTARKEKFIPKLKEFLVGKGIRFDYIIGNVPHGERILINDSKPSGLKTAFAINKIRDAKMEIDYTIDLNL
mgnify:CR=1 FL=1